MSFIYAEQERSERVDNFDKFMNGLFRIISVGSVGIVLFLIYSHISQKNRAGEYAKLIT